MNAVHFIEGLPGLGESSDALGLRTRGQSAVMCSPRFIARLSLASGEAAWVCDRRRVPLSTSTWCLPRHIRISGSDLWYGETGDVVGELLPTEDGGAVVSAYHAETGRGLWEYNIPIPEAADWAEPSPAWDGAQTEEIDAFLPRIHYTPDEKDPVYFFKLSNEFKNDLREYDGGTAVLQFLAGTIVEQ